MKKCLKVILMVSWHYLNGTCGKLKGHGKRRAKDTTLFYYSSGRDCSNGGVVMAVEGKIKFCILHDCMDCMKYFLLLDCDYISSFKYI